MRRSGDNGKASMLPAALLGLAFLAFLLVVGAAASAALLFGGRIGCAGEAVGSVEGVPARLVPIYRSASARYGLGERGPSILAAVNWVETGFGSDLAVSSAEAEGWMQFLPSSWATYGVDANGDGVKDPYNPWDAIFAAARLLRASGAPRDWHGAILSYNHAEWYVEKVERAAERFGGGSGGSRRLSPKRVAIQARRRARRSTRRCACPRRGRSGRFRRGSGSAAARRSRSTPGSGPTPSGCSKASICGSAPRARPDTRPTATAPRWTWCRRAGRSWDETALRAALGLGWTPGCGASGSAPVCPLVPAIQFIGYNGYPGHGDPAHAGSNAHLHVSWKSSDFGCPGLCAPRDWVEVFPWAE